MAQGWQQQARFPAGQPTFFSVPGAPGAPPAAGQSRQPVSLPGLHSHPGLQSVRPLKRAPDQSWEEAPGKQPRPAAENPAWAAAAATAAPAANLGPSKDSYIVSSTGPDTKEVVVRTLIGEYVEMGVNHGRKVFQKMPQRGDQENVTVLMYYWDSRDGPGFEGWWFGNKLGGTQVWSHCKDSGLAPPLSGWKIPWDGAVRPSLTVVNKQDRLKEAAAAKLQQFSEEFGKVEVEASQALEQASTVVVGDDVSIQALSEAEVVLAPHVLVIDEFVAKVAAAQAAPVGDTFVISSFRILLDRCRALQQTLKTRHSEVKDFKQTSEQEAVQKERDEREGAVLDEAVLGATEKTNAAEDMVEKTVITAEMVHSCGDDVDVIRQAIEDTEQAAKQAQVAVGEARIFLNAKLAKLRGLGQALRERGQANLGKLQQQLSEAQNKLTPLKTIRRDVDQRKEAQKLVAEVNEKLALAEVDVDRADEMVAMLAADTPTKESLAQAHQAVSVADQHMTQALRMFESKKCLASGTSLEELTALGPRGDSAKGRITQLKVALKDASERATLDAYIQEATEKVYSVVEAIGKLEEVDARMKGGEDVTPDEMASSEAAASGVQTTASMARMFIQMKMLEVKRMTGESGKAAAVKMTNFQKQIESATKRLAEFKSNISRKKRMALVRELEEHISAAESLVAKVKESASVFADDGKLTELSPDDIRKASELTLAAEKEANDALMDVRKRVTARQIESKGKDTSIETSSELIKFQTRISTATAEVGRQRKLFTSVEQRLAVRRLVGETEKKLDAVEEKVKNVQAAVAQLVDIKDAASSSEVKNADAAAHEAQIAMRTVSRFLESQSRHAKDAMDKIQPRVKAVQEKLEAAVALKKERVEGVAVKALLNEGQTKVAAMEDNLKKAVESELPFRDGGDSAFTSAQASSMVSELEKAIQLSQTKAADAKTFVSMKRLAAKGFSEVASRSVTDSLNSMQTSVDDAQKQLSDMRWRAVEIKKSAMRRKAGGKP